ncbi:hypothetical protein [Nonomuraea candida]|uniref:hypothetical protein n=1 Tax=Nonomuraea candida TaxID=359159 RepID=UPI0005BB2F30|nr:hypothetical protein [Nonomuraea candida]
MRGAHGSIHRRASVEGAYHDFEQEHVVVLRTTHHVHGTTSHHVTPLSIEAAIRLHIELGDLLADTMWDDPEPPF